LPPWPQSERCTKKVHEWQVIVHFSDVRQL
jgi:hypothetical protein